MNEENRKKVENYLNNMWVSTEPLIFEGYESRIEEFDPEKYSVEDMVERALELCKKYFSINSSSEEGNWETNPDRSRSSLDIWRHIKYYYPTITIFQVMNALYILGRERQEVGGLYCSDVGRRVFRLIRIEEEGDWESTFHWSPDEYGLGFNDWKDI